MKPRSQWNWLLWPIAALYSVVSRMRLWCYEHNIFRTRKLPGIVISVGNLTVGGTGKTPLVIFLAQQFAAEGKRTAILTRGYKGTKQPDAHGVPQSDEVALFRNRLGGQVELGVGANRFHAGEVLARHGAACFILDDGFQHLKLARDVDIVLIDATDPFGAGRVLPAGRLREPISALRRAGIIVITRAADTQSPAIEAMTRRYSTSPIFYARTKFECLLHVPELSPVAQPEIDAHHRYFAFCGIGNPAAFFADLRRWGFVLAGERSFADHHAYTQNDFDEVVVAAGKAAASALICTEKDVWNLRNVTLKGMPVYCCRISIELPMPEFREAIASALKDSIPGSHTEAVR